MSFQQVSLDNFEDVFSTTTELSSVAIGGQVLSVSDEFFAEVSNLLLVEPAPSLDGQFGPNGALYSGWESRRHNPTYDWCIIRLGTSGTISGFDIDTSHFDGNEAPQVSVDALCGLPTEQPSVDDARWSEILPKVDLGPRSRHFFKVSSSTPVNYVKLNIYPDGGIARFRVYGFVEPVFPSDPQESFDLAHVFAGGRVEYISDEHFGVGSNLILPGRGSDMGDGWETKRSREEGHKDWAIIRLGTPGVLEQVEIDTAHFKGNFPESCELHALFSIDDINWQTHCSEDQDWTLVLPRTKLGPHRRHHFQLENVENKTYSHVKVTIHPDGGLKRVRIIGCRSDDNQVAVGTPVSIAPSVSPPWNPLPSRSFMSPRTGLKAIIVPVLPLTPEAFAPFGQVIQAYGDHTAAPKGTRITPANGGSASKFHKLSLLTSSYPPDSGATTGISVYRCNSVAGDGDRMLDLMVLERHPYTNQAFIPMGRGSEENPTDPDHEYLIVVAKNGQDDRPNMQTLRAFIATAAQGIVYDTAIWHQPMTVVGKGTMDFACVETQVGNGSPRDCEILELDSAVGVYKLKLPKLEYQS